MLDNKLYLHPSLSSNGDHEDEPKHLDHLGNGKGSGALLCVYMLAFAESCCQPLSLSLHQWGIWRLVNLLICPGHYCLRLGEVDKRLFKCCIQRHRCCSPRRLAPALGRQLQQLWPQLVLVEVVDWQPGHSGWLQEHGTFCRCCAICSRRLHFQVSLLFVA